MNKTLIEWARNPDGTQGYTWNPITGCLNGCKYCYARRLANTRLRLVYLNNDGASAGRVTESADPFAPRWWEQRVYQPAGHVKPSGIFTCDMGELFGPWLDPGWTADVLYIIKCCPQHRFYLLTKQPQELIKWSPFPENCWVGVSAWDHPSFIDACWYLQDIQETVKYVSLEPLLGWTSADDRAKTGDGTQYDIRRALSGGGVSWLIIGAQTKPTIIPERGWVEGIIRACKNEGVAIFLKNSLRYAYDGGVPQEPFYWHDPEDPHSWNLLQEFPDGKVIVGNRAIPRENVAAEIQRMEARA